MKEKFYKFLVNEGVLFQFLENLNESYIKTLDNLCNTKSPCNYIYLIPWIGNYRFWFELNMKWQIELKK